MTQKNTEPITGIGKNPKTHLVQKSNPLLALWQSDLTLAEFKILDTYLSRIDSHKPERRTVIFEKGELEGLLEVKKINNTELEKRLKHLMGSVVKVDDPTKKRGYQLVTLFEEAVAEQDEHGLWKVRLECTQKAMRYFFNIENLGYLRYRLHSVTCLRSRYSYLLFQHLEKNRNIHLSWETDVDVLRTELDANEDIYQEFKRFNDRLLKLCHKELTEKTDCQFDYTPVKRGRRVVAVRFTLEPTVNLPSVIPNQYAIDDWQDNHRDDICYGFSSDEFADFTDEQLNVLKDLAWPKKRSEDIERHNDALHDIVAACQYATSDYLRQKILIAKTKQPKNLFLYIKKMVENDGKEQ